MALKAKIACSHSEIWPLSKFKPHPRNPNTHPTAQLRLLGKIILGNGWRSPICVSKRSGFVIKGHGRLAAAELIGLKEAPADIQDYANEKDEIADLMADNQISEMSEIDADTFAKLVEELQNESGFDLELAGIDLSEIDPTKVVAEPPESMVKNMEEIAEIHRQRREGNEEVAETRDTEKFIIIVFASRAGKNTTLRRLGLPEDERYIPSSDVKLTRIFRTARTVALPKSAKANKTGATG